MESIFKAVMRGSIERQHRVGVAMQGAKAVAVMLILGGAGDMGGWFHNFAHLLRSPGGHRRPGDDAPCQKSKVALAIFDEIEDLGRLRRDHRLGAPERAPPK